jgi:hypothetical protein
VTPETTTDAVPAGRVRLSDIPTLDITTLTLGEMAAAELETGRSFQDLLKGRATQRLLALWLDERRNSARPRSWRELGDLRPYVGSSSTSDSTPDSPSETSPT